MEVSFNRFNHFESSDIYLCNPNKQELGVVLGTATCTLRLNDISELTLEVQKYVKNSKGEKIVQPCYDLLQGKRLLLVDKIGYFEITRTVENDDDNGVYKTVSAESHQTTFKGKLGFTTEERVYKFFNSADPYDEHYQSEDLGSVPSVVGQLYQQLGVRVDLQDQDNEATTDYDYWTITYIDDILRYGENKDDAIYRSFSDNQTNGYDFMVNDVENAFEMIWIFDFLHHTIKAKLVTSITTPTDIYLAFDNLMQTLELTENAENIKTVLSCNGGDLDIRTVNPMGTNYIVNFDYYKDPDGKWMSKELIEALDKWEELYKSKETNFINLVKELREKYEQQTKYQNIITDTQLRIDELNNARDQFILNYPLLAETFYDGELSADPNSQFHTSQLNVSQRFVCYRKSPSVENGKLVFATVGRNCTLADGYNDNYLYFQDNDTNTYLKLIKNANGLVGVERYGQYDAISQWSGASENSGLIIVGETVNIGETSLQEGSVFYANPFVKNDKTNYLCYKEPPKLVDGKFDYGDQVPLASSFDSCLNSGYLYFRNGSDDNYCKLNQSAEVDVETNTATYYASGFTRYTTMEFVTTWIDLQEQYNKSIENSNNSLQEEIDSIVAEMQSISKECNIQDYVRNYDETGKLYNELNCYWIEGTYENENLAVLDDTTMEETIDLAMQLKEAGEYQLKRVAQPSFSFTISTLDFTKLPQFKQFTHQLKLGRTISVEKASGLIYIPAVTEITFDLDNAEEFTMTFSNSLKLNENEFTFMDLVAQSAKVADGVISNWKDLLDYAKHKKDISTLIANPLDRSLRAAMTNMANQEFIVDTTGILGRKYEDDSQSSFLDEQMRIMNNTILFTDDNWKTVKTALGKIYYDDIEGNEQSAYGLIAQTIIGQLVMSEALNIVNNDSSIVLDSTGLCIKHGDKIVFRADTDGNVTITGNVEALTGYIGDEKNGFTINSTSISHNLSDLATRILIGSGEDTTTYTVTNRGVNHLMLLAGENFAVTQNGDLYANSGYIAELLMQRQIRHSDTGDYVMINGVLTRLDTIPKYSDIYTVNPAGTYVKINDRYVLIAELVVTNPGYMPDASGDFISLNGRYEQISTLTKYNEVFTQTARGSYVIVGDEYVFGSTLPRYIETFIASIDGNYVVDDGEYVLGSSLLRFVQVYDVSVNGDYVIDNNNYVLISSLTHYKYEDGEYIEDENGEYVYLNNSYVLLAEVTKYSLRYQQNGGGAYVYINGVYVRYDSLTKYSQYFTEQEGGEYVFVDGVYVLYSTLPKYTRSYVVNQDGLYLYDTVAEQYKLISDYQRYRYDFYVQIDSNQVVLFSTLTRYNQEYQQNNAGNYIVINGAYVDYTTLPRYNESGEPESVAITTQGLYGKHFKIETSVENAGSTIISFWSEDEQSPELVITNAGINAKGGFFEDLACEKVTTTSLVTTSIEMPELNISGSTILSKKDGSSITFAAQASGTKYYAKLWWNWWQRILHLDLYDANGNSAVNIGTGMLTFYIHWAVIWGGDNYTRVDIPPGQPGWTLDTKAFWGIDYATFSSPSVSKNNRTQWFDQGGTEGTPAISIKGTVLPASGNTYDLGTDSQYWRWVYANSYYGMSQNIFTSDINKKHDIEALGDKYSEFFDLLKPVLYKYNDGESGRVHIGLIAQDMLSAIHQSGLDTRQVAAYCSWKDDNGNETCGIRYGELVSLNIYEIQKLKQRVKALEEEIEKYKKEVTK